MTSIEVNSSAIPGLVLESMGCETQSLSPDLGSRRPVRLERTLVGRLHSVLRRLISMILGRVSVAAWPRCAICGLGVRVALLVGCLAWMTGPLRAQLRIDLPEVSMLPDKANQSFPVYLGPLAEPVLVNGIGFNIQVADGGPDAGGVIDGPTIAFVDIFTGTAFESNNNGSSGSGQIVPQVYERGTLTHPDKSPEVTLQSGARIATVTLDTTGLSPGTYKLTLNTLNGPTKFTTLGEDQIPLLIDGTVTIVPEPGVWGIATAAALLLFTGARIVRGRRT